MTLTVSMWASTMSLAAPAGARAGLAAAALVVLLCGPVLPDALAGEASPAGGSPAAEAREAGSGASIADLVREADAAFARRDYDAARRLYEQAVTRGADGVHALHRLALLRSWAGDLGASAAAYRRALERAPGELDLSLELASVLERKNDLREAIRIYEALRAAHADEPRVLLGLGRALGRKGRHAEADAVLRDMQDRRLEPIRAHVARARLLAAQGRFDRAADFYRDALRADPRNLEARLGLAENEHAQGFDRKAVQQIEAIVLDHPESREARDLQKEIHDALRPRIRVDGTRLSDDDSNRLDSAVAAYTFMAEPQTSVTIGYGLHDASVRCESRAVCDELAPPSGPFSIEAGASAEILDAGLISRIIGPITFHARAGAARQETFGEKRRTVGIGGGFLRWQVGPRLALVGTGGREALVDTAPLVDRGLRVDTAEVRMEFRFRPSWLLTAGAGYGSYSDRNARRSASASIEWRLPIVRPRVAGTFEALFREFNEDTDHGYFDPLRYDSELLTVAIWDRYRRGRIFWRVQGSYGRQDVATGGGTAPDPVDDDTVRAVNGAFGVEFGTRASLEAFYWRSDHALQTATGFASRRSGLLFRLRI